MSIRQNQIKAEGAAPGVEQVVADAQMTEGALAEGNS